MIQAEKSLDISFGMGLNGHMTYKEGIMEISTNTYSAHDVAAAAQVSPATLQNWLKRGVIVGHGNDAIEGGGIQGKHRRFSFFALMQISVAAALIEASGGMQIKQAFYAAMTFAHSGHVASGWTGDDGISDDDEPSRHASYPYHFRHGKTLLATVGGKTAILLENGSGDTFGNIRAALQRATGFTIIDAGEVFDRVCAALGEHPNTVLDAAYSDIEAD